MKTKVVVLYDKPEEFVAELEERAPWAEFHACVAYEGLERSLETVKPEVLLAYKFEPTAFPREVILNCPSLRWLSVGFAGIDHIVPWDEEKLVVTNAAGVAAPEMAHYTLAAVFGLFQLFPAYFRNQVAREWRPRLVRSARGAKIGLVGFGHAGREIARNFRALGMSVSACRAHPQPAPELDKVYGMSDLDHMLETVDVVVVCTALTSATRNLFDARRFAAMRRGSYFVNISRGEVVDEAALLQALNDGQLAGAAIDVARTEPLPSADPLWDAPNLIITPHTCSEYVGWFRDAAMMFADNLERWRAGEPLLNKVSSSRGY